MWGEAIRSLPLTSTTKTTNMSKYGFQFFHDIIIIHGLTLLYENIETEVLVDEFREEIEAGQLAITVYKDERPFITTTIKGKKMMKANPHRGLEKVRIEGYCNANKWQVLYPKAKLIGKLEKGIQAKADRETAKLMKELEQLEASENDGETLPF